MDSDHARKSEMKRAARMISAGIDRLLTMPGEKPYPTCVRMMIEVADVWSECDEHAKVEHWLKKAEVLAKVFMPWPRCEILNIWHSLHAHYTRVGDYAKAVECAVQSAEFASVNFGIAHNLHIEKRKTLAKSLFNAGRTDEAIAVSLETEQLERA